MSAVVLWSRCRPNSLYCRQRDGGTHTVVDTVCGTSAEIFLPDLTGPSACP